MDDMEKTRLEKEGLAQRCHELELRLNLLMEEKSNLSAEFEHLQVKQLYAKLNNLLFRVKCIAISGVVPFAGMSIFFELMVITDK